MAKGNSKRIGWFFLVTVFLIIFSILFYFNFNTELNEAKQNQTTNQTNETREEPVIDPQEQYDAKEDTRLATKAILDCSDFEYSNEFFDCFTVATATYVDTVTNLAEGDKYCNPEEILEIAGQVENNLGLFIDYWNNEDPEQARSEFVNINLKVADINRLIANDNPKCDDEGDPNYCGDSCGDEPDVEFERLDAFTYIIAAFKALWSTFVTVITFGIISP